MKEIETRVYKRGQIIFKQGEFEKCMYDIRWGEVGIYVNYGEKDEKLLTKLPAETFFGEMGMIDGSPRSATAVALEKDTRVAVIEEESFMDYFRDKPAKVLSVMEHMSARLRRLTEDYADACKTAADALKAQEEGKTSKELTERQEKYAKEYRSSTHWNGGEINDPYWHL